jgi:diadenosine tetraphosphate (Ap4A) HIT family hydrolase
VTQIDTTQSASSGWWARFTFNGINRYDQGAYDLVGGEELRDAERDQLLQLCRQRLDAFREQRGEEVFAHRSRHRTPISGSIKYRVLTRAKGRCECCGASCCLANPASTGPGGGPHRAQKPWRLGRPQQPAGPLLPLQCRQARCSLPTQEGTTDFSGLQASYASRKAGCVFCALEASGRVLLENELALCIADADPVTSGHSLVIPRRHVADGLALHQPEWNAVVELLKRRREQLSAQDASISGWNVGLNSGESAGQTVFHAHWHLIPRRDGDCEQQRGGVRGVIPAHQSY